MTGAAGVTRLSENESLFGAVETLWNSTTKKKMYVTVSAFFPLRFARLMSLVSCMCINNREVLVQTENGKVSVQIISCPMNLVCV